MLPTHRQGLDKVNIQADVIANELTNLVYSENAPEIQAVCLAMYGNHAPTVSAALQTHSRNLTFCAQYVGLGAAVDVERFRRVEEDEKKKAGNGQVRGGKGSHPLENGANSQRA